MEVLVGIVYVIVSLAILYGTARFAIRMIMWWCRR
jgi:hypothetical protein